MKPVSRGSDPAGERLHRALSGTLIGLALLEVLVLGSSLAGWPLSRGAALLCLLFSVTAGVAAGARLPRGPVPPISASGSAPGWLVVPLVAAGGLTFLALAFAAYIAPDLSWDGNLYHLPTLQFWAQAGNVCWVDEQFRLADLANGYPKGAELVGFVLVRAFGDGNLSNTFNLVFLPLGVLGIASLARTLGIAPAGALAAGAAYLMVPVNINQSGTTYIDAAYGAAVIAWLAVLMRALSPEKEGGILRWREAPALAAALGLAVAIRPTGLLLIPLLIGAVAGAGWMARRSRPLSRSFPEAIRFLAVVLAGALIVGGYWYARNIAHTGNPIYPVGIRVAGWSILSGRPLADTIFPDANAALAHPGLNRPLQVLYSWSQGLSRWPHSIRGADTRAGGLGFLWLAGCVPALIWILLRAARSSAERSRLRPALALFALTAALFLLTPMRWWARYTVWIYGAGLPVLALSLQDAAGRLSPRRSSALAPALLGILVLLEGAVAADGVLGNAYPGPRPIRVADLFHSHDWQWPANYLLKSTRGTLLDEIAASDANVAVGPLRSPTRRGRAHAMIYGELSMSPGRRRVLPVGDPLSARDRERIRRESIRYLLWDGIRKPPLQQVPGVRTVRAAGLWVLVLPPGGLPTDR